MILVDNSQVLMSSIFAQERDVGKIDERLVRHIVLNTYRTYRKKFHREYGELVICNDSGQSWRREFFPQYKANRRQARKDDEHKWDEFYRILNTVRDEIREVFPYRTMGVSGCEADDIIAYLAKRFHATEKVLILSGDKDFSQLHIFPGVAQFSPLQKKFVEVENPKQFLMEHIIKGDSSDGVPNILSEDDCFVVDGKRQHPLTGKRMKELLEFIREYGHVQEKYRIAWNRNETLIDLLNLPPKQVEKIEEEWNKPFTPSRGKILDYMIENGLRNLMEDIGDF